MSIIADIPLPIEVDVLTGGCLAEVVNAIFELLLYQRGQIPLVYKMYKLCVTKWTEENNDENEHAKSENVTNYQLERQREIAIETKNAISQMRRLICDTLEGSSVRTLRFLFGATPYTPKEVYNISIPAAAVSRQHSHVQHQLPPARLNQSLMTLLTHKDLSNTFSTNLPPTNIYCDIEIMENDSTAKATNSRIYPKEFAELPAKCKQINFVLSHLKPETEDSLLCCKDLQIYQDFRKISLTKTEPEHVQKDEEEAVEKSASFGWWESDLCVHGFKEKLIKGHSIWTK